MGATPFLGVGGDALGAALTPATPQAIGPPGQADQTTGEAGAVLSLVIVIRMRPRVRRDLVFDRQPDHVCRRRISWRPARSAFQRGLQLPHRRIAWAPDRVERQAGPRLARTAFDL
jgi:hypothetical protein